MIRENDFVKLPSIGRFNKVVTYPLDFGLAALSRHCFSLNNALSVSLIVVLDARGRARPADLHLDFGQPMLDLPLLLIQLGAHCRLLGLQTFQTLAETLNLRQQRLVRAEQRYCALAHQLSHTVASHAYKKEDVSSLQKFSLRLFQNYVNFRFLHLNTNAYISYII